MNQKTTDDNSLYIFGLGRKDSSDPLQHNINHIHKAEDVSSLVCQATVIYKHLYILSFQIMSSGVPVLSQKYKERQITS